MKTTISAVSGIKIGHAQDEQRLTGCTVAVLPEGATVGVDIRGGAPGSYNAACFQHTTQRETADAIFFAGGSFFGLDVAPGVRKCLKEKGRGMDTGYGLMPCVTGAIIFDLRVAQVGVHPGAKMGYEACENATSTPVAEGNVGAGIGATCGKLLGQEYWMKGGLGSSAMQYPNKLQVGALAVVNCLGNVFDLETNKTIAGTRKKEGGGFYELSELFTTLQQPLPQTTSATENTTIGMVATNVKLTKKEATKVAEMAHNGLARSIRPVHTLADGDTIYAVATGELELPPSIPISLVSGPRLPDDSSSPLAQFTDRSRLISFIGHLASEEMRKAVIRAVCAAKSVKGIPSASDFL
jgi:L-aminopeptidase/D-esterase-like protein